MARRRLPRALKTEAPANTAAAANTHEFSILAQSIRDRNPDQMRIPDANDGPLASSGPLMGKSASSGRFVAAWSSSVVPSRRTQSPGLDADIMIKVMDHTPSSLRFGCRRAGTLLRWALAAVAVAAPAPAAGQLVDRGTFALYSRGEEVGTEEFTIQRVGAGEAQATLATGTLTLRDGRIVKTILRLVGPSMVLNDYEVSVSGSDTLTVRVVRSGDRLLTRTEAPWGEEAWEYPARTATVIFDEGVAHHYFLLGALIEAHGAEARIHAMAPLSEMEELPARPDVGAETIDVGGERIETTRIRLSSGEDSREAWFDGSGRLVRVAWGTRGFEALRLP